MMEKIKGRIMCPVCEKEKMYVYLATGCVSSRCAKCGRLIMWDFDMMTASVIRKN